MQRKDVTIKKKKIDNVESQMDKKLKGIHEIIHHISHITTFNDTTDNQ